MKNFVFYVEFDREVVKSWSHLVVKPLVARWFFLKI